MLYSRDCHNFVNQLYFNKKKIEKKSTKIRKVMSGGGKSTKK